MPFKSLLTTTGFIMILITVCRTLFYQFFLLFVGLSVGFLLNAEYVGWKYPVVSTSICNIFYPIDFEDEGVLQFLYGRGRLKVFGVMGKYQNVEIIEEAMAAEEWYWVKFSHLDKNGNRIIEIQNIRVRWKPWEYYYEDEAMVPMTEEEMKKYLKEGSLNSRDTDRAWRLRDELRAIEGSKLKI
jgi:hypothetical protein